MTRILTLALAALSLSGCMRAYTITMGPQPSADAHYVVVKTKWNGKMKVFDCMSQPDGNAWEPTCRQVKMQSTLGKTLDDTWSKLRNKD